MKAVLSKETGGPETLVVEEIDTPTAGSGEVLVKVAACAINFPDSLIIKDMYQMKPPRPFCYFLGSLCMFVGLSPCICANEAERGELTTLARGGSS